MLRLLKTITMNILEEINNDVLKLIKTAKHLSDLLHQNAINPSHCDEKCNDCKYIAIGLFENEAIHDELADSIAILASLYKIIPIKDEQLELIEEMNNLQIKFNNLNT